MLHTLPHIHSRLVPRPRLIALLQQAEAARIVTIIAPAGYGKTTFGGMWLRQLAAQFPRNAMLQLWLTCSDEDNDPVRLAHNVLRSIAVGLSTAMTADDAAPANLNSVLNALRSMPGAALPLFESTVRAIAEIPRTIVLALDDLHLIHSEAARSVLQSLIGAAPSNLHLLFLSRTPPNLQLPTATLRISADDLRFDHAEFLRYVRNTRLADLSDAALATLENRAEGWITALQLFAVAPGSVLREAEETNDLPLRRDFVDEYFERFVLRDRPDAIRRFLLHTAPLSTFDASLAAQALGISVDEGATFIDAVLASDLFLQEYKGVNHSRTFTYHPLFREFLEQRFVDEYGRSALNALLMRMAAAFAESGDVDAALDFYLRAGDVPRALQQLAACIRPAMRTGDTVPALRWLTRFSDAQIESIPALALDAAWLSQIVGDASRRPALERARRAASGTSDQEHITALLTLEALTCQFEGRYSDARRFTDEACAAPPPQDPMIEGYRLCARALSPIDPSDWHARVDTLGTAVERFRQADFSYGMIYASAARAAMQRRFADGAGTLHSLAALMRSLGDRLDLYSGSALDARAVYAETLYMVDQLDEAQRQFRLVLDAHIQIPEMEFSMQKAAIYLDSIQSIQGSPQGIDPDADMATWRRALSLLSPIAIGSLAYQRVIRDYLRGTPTASRPMLDAADIHRSSQTDIARLAALTFEVMCANFDPAIGSALAEMLAGARTPAGRLAHMRIAAPYAIFLDATGQPAEAEAVLHEVLPLVRDSRMHRIILDCPPIGGILKRIRIPFAQRLYVRLHPEAAPYDLSRAELRVLQLAAAGLRRTEIAQRIDRRSITVGRHLVHAYRKLGVHTRADALRVLREVGIVE